MLASDDAISDETYRSASTRGISNTAATVKDTINIVYIMPCQSLTKFYLNLKYCNINLKIYQSIKYEL